MYKHKLIYNISKITMDMRQYLHEETFIMLRWVQQDAQASLSPNIYSRNPPFSLVGRKLSLTGENDNVFGSHNSTPSISVSPRLITQHKCALGQSQ
jgi:hypothetical protein